MKRLIHIAALAIFTLGQILPYRPAYAGDPVPNPVSPAESSSPTIAIDTATQSSDQEVAPTNTTEPTDTTQFLASMDATPLSAEEAPAITFTASTKSKGESTFSYNLQIAVDQDRNVIVTWDNETRNGILEPDSYHILLEPSQPDSFSGVWILSLAYRGGELSLDSLQTHSQTGVSERKHWYVFTENGLLSFESSQGYSVGKEADGVVYEIKEEGEVYYAYDHQNNLRAWVDVFDRSVNGLTSHTAYYRFNDWRAQTRTEVDVRGMKESLLDDIDSVQDYEIIDQFAHSKTIRRYSNGDLNSLDYDYEIQYVADESGAFVIPKRVYQDGKNFIVQGAPDVLSEETNDIFLADRQSFKGYAIYYGEAYELSTVPVFPHPTFLGYGLVFEKFERLPDGRTEDKV